MRDSFDEAFDHVLGVEGGFVNDPSDRGGATNFGVTLKTLADFRGTPVTPADVRSLSRDEAKEIYRKKFWEPLGCDRIYSPIVALIHFDQGVNRGVTSAVKSLQEVLGVVSDGRVGSKTLAALRGRDQRTIALELIFKAQEHYSRIVQRDSSQSRFLVGWLRRTHSLLRKLLQD